MIRTSVGGKVSGYPMQRLLESIGRIRPTGRSTVIVVIDGLGASGKTTLADGLADRLKNAWVVRTDDFARPNVLGWDWGRMQRHVIEPIERNEPSRYQRYDWPTDRLAEWQDVLPGGVLIVEGVSAMRAELGKYWDLAIWVSCPYATRLERGVARDGEAKRGQWVNVWMPEEERYEQEEHPEQRADVVLDGERPFEL